MESHPGHTKLPSRRKILAQRDIHTDIVRETKKDNRRKKQILQTRKEKIRDPKVISKFIFSIFTAYFLFTNWIVLF